MKIAVVFWSQTGNTEIMANKVAEGAQEAGAQVDILTPDAFSAGAVSGYDAIAFGCPAMGDEVLEEAEFEPMFADVEGALGGKKIALFATSVSMAQTANVKEVRRYVKRGNRMLHSGQRDKAYEQYKKAYKM